MFSTLLHMALPLAIAACATADKRPDSTGASTTAAAAPGAPFRVALLTPGPISDQSWNAGAYQGLIRIRDSLGAQVSHIQTKTPAEFEENFRQYGAQGYALVFGHGFEFKEPARRVAGDYPRTQYVITSGDSAQGNVSSIVFGFANSSYLAGIVAGGLTKSNVLGAIGGTELPPVKESFAAFAAGARSVNPKVKILTSYIGNWDDVSAAKEQALAQIAQGVDVVFQNADAAGLGVFQAAREGRKATVIGSNSNQNAIAPEVTAGSVVIDLPHAFLTVARAVKAGGFTGHVIRLGTASDVVRYVPNPAFATRLSAPAQHAVDSVEALIRARKLVVPGFPADTAER